MHEAGVVSETKRLWLEGYCIEYKISDIDCQTSPDGHRVADGITGKEEKKEGRVGLRDLILREMFRSSNLQGERFAA